MNDTAKKLSLNLTSADLNRFNKIATSRQEAARYSPKKVGILAIDYIYKNPKVFGDRNVGQVPAEVLAILLQGAGVLDLDDNESPTSVRLMEGQDWPSVDQVAELYQDMQAKTGYTHMRATDDVEPAATKPAPRGKPRGKK